MSTYRREKRDLSHLLDDIGPIEVLSRPRVAPGRKQVPNSNVALVLDVRRLQLMGVLNEATLGRLLWDGEEQSDMPAALYSYGKGCLTIHEVARSGRFERLDLRLAVEQLRVFTSGGVRPWLQCPNRTRSGICGRRATKLLLLDGETQFKCWFCAGRRRKLRLRQLSEATSHMLSRSAATR